jgi:hypothetical protein
MPAYAGIHVMKTLDPGMRRDDDRGIIQMFREPLESL